MTDLDLEGMIDTKIFNILRIRGYGPVNPTAFGELVEELTAGVLDALDDYSDQVEEAYMAEPLPTIFLGGTNG